MTLEEAIAVLDEIDKGGPGTYGPDGQTSGEVFTEVMNEPGAAQALVDRYAGSTNGDTVNNLAFMLGELADGKRADTVNLIFDILERTTHGDDRGIAHICLLTIRTQAIYGTPWDPPEPTPTALGRFLVHSLGLEPDSLYDHADTAVNILWNLHLWAKDRGGLRAVFNAEERQAFRDKFDEGGLDPGPILKSLGED